MYPTTVGIRVQRSWSRFLTADACATDPERHDESKVIGGHASSPRNPSAMILPLRAASARIQVRVELIGREHSVTQQPHPPDRRNSGFRREGRVPEDATA